MSRWPCGTPKSQGNAFTGDIGDYLPEMRKQHIPKPGVALTVKPAKQNISIGKTDMHRTTRIMRANI